MAGGIDLFRHPGKLLSARPQMQGSALLSPGGLEVFHGFRRGLSEPAGQTVQKSGQHLGARNHPPRGLAKGDRDLFEFAGKIGSLLGKIEAQPQDGEREPARAGHGFDQQAGELLIFPKKIVGPLQAGFKAGERFHGIRRGQGAKDGEQGKVSCIGFQEDRAPEAERMIGEPKVALAAAAGGLNFSRPDGRDFLRFAGQILRGAGFCEDMDPPLKRASGWQEGLDESGFERVGRRRPRRFGFRGRNCRKS